MQLDDQSDLTPHFQVVFTNDPESPEGFQVHVNLERGGYGGLILLKSLTLKCPPLNVQLHEDFVEKLVQWYVSLEGALQWFVPLGDLARMVPLGHLANTLKSSSALGDSRVHNPDLAVPEVHIDLTLIRAAQRGQVCADVCFG